MSKRFVSIWFPHLLTDWFAISDPLLRDTCYVIRTAVRGQFVVVAASPKAQEQGICTGMVLADAKAIMPGLQVLDEKQDLNTRLLNVLALWCIRFTPFTAVDAPGGLLLDSTGCSHLWGGDLPYLTEIHKRLQGRGYHVRIALSSTVGAAWGQARFGSESSIIEICDPLQALEGLPVAALRLNATTSEHLNKLGIRQIKDLLRIPRHALRRRFGPEVIVRMDQALGKEEEKLMPVRIPVPYQERLSCIAPITTRTGIEIALNRLLVILCTRLKKEQMGLRSAVFKGYDIDGGLSQIAIDTSAPSYNKEHLFKLFEIKLQIIQPGSGIELFILEATKIENHMPEQEKLWEGSPDASNVPIAELLDRVAMKVGNQCIYRFLPAARYWPERSILKATSLQEKTQESWRVERPRPVQLLKNAEPIEVTAPIPDYPPMHFRYKGKIHKIVKADGPERIEQEWWIQEGEHRDYYYVEDEEGFRYWLFRSGHYNEEKTYRWFLHGFFI